MANEDWIERVVSKCCDKTETGKKVKARIEAELKGELSKRPLKANELATLARSLTQSLESNPSAKK
jgi:hypothetical protein